jgi:hypothetical protein
LAPIALLLIWSLPNAWCHHQNARPLWLGGLGFTVLLLSLFVPAAIEPVLAMSGGLTLMVAHLLNRRLLSQHLLIHLATPAVQHGSHS